LAPSICPPLFNLRYPPPAPTGGFRTSIQHAIV
jgi:hypothetical protein